MLFHLQEIYRVHTYSLQIAWIFHGQDNILTGDSRSSVSDSPPPSEQCLVANGPFSGGHSSVHDGGGVGWGEDQGLRSISRSYTKDVPGTLPQRATSSWLGPRFLGEKHSWWPTFCRAFDQAQVFSLRGRAFSLTFLKPFPWEMVVESLGARLMYPISKEHTHHPFPYI